MKTVIRKEILTEKSTVTFTLKSNALNIFEEPQNNLWTYDLEGRLVGMYVNKNNYRRTLDNRYFLKYREELDGEVFRQVKQISQEDIYPYIEKSKVLIDNNIQLLPDEFIKPISNILNMNSYELHKSGRHFSNVYLPISILPPDQYMSLVVQMTEGCNYNLCTFCNFYRDRPFKIKSVSELNSHLKAIKTFLGDGLALRKSIFLADANALAVPQKRLISSLEIINNQFPQFNNIYSFVDVFTGIKKSVNDFKQLNKNGVKRAYLGVESGNSDLMLFLNKKQLNKDIIELTRSIKDGDINVGIVLLVGAGGSKFAAQHLTDSVKLLKNLPLSKGDIVYLSELNITNSEYTQSMLSNYITLPSKTQIRHWSNELKIAIKNVLPKEVQTAVYDINQFFY